MDSDWAGLPQHLLDSVVDRLVAQLDFARFSIVCMSWHSVAKHNQSHRAKLLGRDQPPMLMISTDQEGFQSETKMICMSRSKSKFSN
ncbi:probable F-box protein At1g65740 isoform X2 [Prunus avium]|uniref:Probable F-box protein At1g65740 isoform X2 n=1 Tax=Prunus avium TaxID=42229 RepID=A0A6P5R5L0_PRUAV|nr:probable F-box protein At1g65740 isoform X2 [Prunus avium]